jgi:tetratricopeptide (TPR) repeat protein
VPSSFVSNYTRAITRILHKPTNALGTAKYFLGLYRDALTMHSQGLAIRQRIADIDRVTLSDSLHNVGSDYWMLARYAEAEQALTQALSIREEKLGDNHPKVANTLSNLGLVYQVTGRFAESEKGLNRSLEIREQLYGRQHPDVATSLNNLGTDTGSRAGLQKPKPPTDARWRFEREHSAAITPASRKACSTWAMSISSSPAMRKRKRFCVGHSLSKKM